MTKSDQGSDPEPGSASSHHPTARAHDDRVGIGAWWMVFVLFTFYMNSLVDRTIIAHLVDPISRSLHIGDFEMGMILGPAFALAYCLAALPAGWMVDRFDRRYVAGGAMLFWSLMTMACGLAAGVASLAFARMMIAVGEAFLTPVSYALIADRFPARRLSSALAAYNMGSKVGISVAFFSAAAAITAAGALQSGGLSTAGFEKWQIVFFLVGAPGILLAALPLTFGKLRPLPRRPGHGPGAEFDQAGLVPFMLRCRPFLVPFFIGVILIAIVNGALSNWLPTFMQRHFGWQASQYGPWLGMITGLSAFLTIPQGMLVDRLFAKGRRDASVRYFSWVLAATAPVSIFAFYLGNPWMFLPCMGIIYTLVLPYPVYVGIIVQIISPQHLRGRMTGVIIALIPIFSQGLGPLSVGAMTDFVFDDPRSIGTALSIISIVGLFGSFFAVRYSLKPLAALMDEMNIAGPVKGV